MDKTSSTQSHDISPPPYITLNPQLSITPTQCRSKWKAVRTFGSNNVPLSSSPLGKKFLPLTFIAACWQCRGIIVLM